MAVEEQRIKARVRAKYPNANLSAKRLDALAAKLATKPADDADDAAIDLVLEDFNGILSFEDIAKEDDRVRTLENKPAPTPTPTPAPAPNPMPSPEDPTAKLLSAIEKLTGEVAEIKSGKITESKKTIAQQRFESSEVLKALKPELKESWLNRIAVTPETTQEEIDAQVKNLEVEYTDLTQSFADSKGYSQAPFGGTGEVKFSQEEAEKIVGNIL